MLAQNIQDELTLNRPAEPSGNMDIHTMPEKFLSMRPSLRLGKNGKKRIKKPMTLRKNLTIGLLAILIVGSLMVLAAWLFLKSVNEPSSDLSPAEDFSAADSQIPMSDTSAPQSTSSPPTELPTQDESLLNFDQWLSFESSTYDYQFKYPPAWQVEEDNNPSPANTLYVASLQDQSNLEHFALTIFSNPTQQSLLDWLQDNFDIDRIDLESFSLQGYSAYQYEDILAKLDIVYILFNQKIYQLAFSKTESNILNQVYTQIIINFKFESAAATPQDEPLDLTPAVDTDSDNLTDLEEELYATDKNQSDTDGDSYSDGDEVVNLYHPGMPGSTRIYSSELVSTYINNTYNYNLIYPSAWSIKGRDDSIIFQDKAGEFIQVLITPNEEGFTNIKSWYQAVINSDISTLTNTSLAGQPAIRTANGTQLYFLLGDNIYSLIYNMGLRAEPNFMTTFNMMIKSFKFMSAPNQ